MGDAFHFSGNGKEYMPWLLLFCICKVYRTETIMFVLRFFLFYILCRWQRLHRTASGVMRSSAYVWPITPELWGLEWNIYPQVFQLKLNPLDLGVVFLPSGFWESKLSGCGIQGEIDFSNIQLLLTLAATAVSIIVDCDHTQANASFYFAVKFTT